MSSRQQVTVTTRRVIAVGVIPRRTGLKAMIADCTIELDHGDITQESTRAIVNSICGGGSLGGGECNRAITNAAGPTVATEYKSSARGNQDIVMTNAGNLRQDKVFHVVAKKDTSVLKSIVEKTLQKAESEELDSVTFPALGTGHMGGDAKRLAVPMFEAMRDFALEDRPIVLRTIRLVIYKGELFDIYQEAMQETLGRYCMD